MKTQLSILFKNTNAFTTGRILFTKAKVTVYIDGENNPPIILKANRQPQTIELSPGTHRIYFKFNNTLAKLGDQLVGAAVGAGMGMSLSGAAGVMGALGGAGTVGSFYRTQDNILDCTLNDGDILHISIHPKRSGKVKIKVLQ